MNLSKYALSNKPLIISILIVLVIGGFYAYLNMSKLEDPEIKVKTSMVLTLYPGASAHQVELELTDQLEKAIKTMPNIGTIESVSENDMSLIKIEMETTVPDDETQQMFDILRRKMHDVTPSLPMGAREPIVLDDYGDVYGMFYAMTSDGIEDSELSEYAHLIERKVQEIEGISKVSIYGSNKKCVNIEMEEDNMANLGVHPGEIIKSINSQNQTVYSGYFESGEKRMRIGMGDTYTSIADIENLIIQGHEKDQLRLKDVAKVSLGYEKPVRNSMRYDGEHAIGILISAESGTDITKLGEKVDNTIAELQHSTIPAGIAFHHVFFQPDIVKDSMNTFLINLLESVLIVVFILMLAMGFKSGVIIAVSLIVIVFGSFFVLDIFDGTLQRVSLGAFILAMGMLVDNAIVIIDGIMVDLKRGVPKPEALTNIGKKTAMPLLGATIIAILAFSPIVLSPDMAGTYVRDLFIVLAVSLLLSWLLALTHVPIHADFSLKVKPQKDGESDLFDSKYYRKLRKVLNGVLNHKMVTIAVAVILVGISAYCYKFIPQMFFPDMSYDQIYVEYNLPYGTTVERVERDLVEMEKYFFADKNVEHVTTSIGGTPGRYCLVRAIAEPAMNYGEVIVQFKNKKKMLKEIPKMQKELMEMFPEAYLRVKQYNLMYRKYPIEAAFSGPDPSVLKSLASQAEEIMRNSEATYLVTNDWADKVPSLMVNYDQSVARNAGITRSDAGISLMAAAGGIPSGTYISGNEQYTIYIKSTEPDGSAVESLENAPIWSMSPSLLSSLDMETIKGLFAGIVSYEDIVASSIKSVPLSEITNGVSIQWEEPVVRRVNGERTIKVQCNNTDGYTAAQAREAILPEIEKIEIPDGYTLSWLGEYDASKTSTKYLFKNVPLAIILMFLIMIALFNDIKKPLVIVCCLPLIAVGVVFGILATGQQFGFVAIVGTLGIIGMMIKNGIVLIDEINRQITSGIDSYEALVSATLSRFRPVMMASLTTVVGMFPLLSDPLFGSLAVTIMCGLTVGTIITLVFLPVVYALFFKIRRVK
jgi:multidrug efflux pump subunit AcrB